MALQTPRALAQVGASAERRKPIWEVEAERLPERTSRLNYPGSKAGGRTRYDLPRRHKAYGNADEGDMILFAGSSLQPEGMMLKGDGGLASLAGKPTMLGGSGGGAVTPRNASVLSASGKAVLSSSVELLTAGAPDLPIVGEANDVHGVLVVGGREAGKTSLILSIAAAVNGTYPCGSDVREKRETMPVHGQSYEIPEREVKMVDGGPRQMRVLFTDTPPCGTSSNEEMPLCMKVSPHSSQYHQAVPSWMRIALRSGNWPHYAVLFCVDATAAPLWEDSERCRDLARLLFTLKKSQYTVVVAVTKMPKAREDAIRAKNQGVEGGLDPRNSYEAFSSRYVEKVCVAIQAAAGENAWQTEVGEQQFPLPNVTLFDVPTWSGAAVYKSWEDRRAREGCSAEMPNLRYATSQLRRLLTALCVRSCNAAR